MSTTFATLIVAMGLGRIAIGLAPFLAAAPTARVLGFPSGHDSPTTRVMARLFGVRDIGLGVLAFYAVIHPATAGFIFLFNACMDGGDLFAFAIPLAKRQGIDRGALRSSSMAIGGALAWLAVWWAL